MGVCVRACVRACIRACMCVCVCVCVCACSLCGQDFALHNYFNYYYYYLQSLQEVWYNEVRASDDIKAAERGMLTGLSAWYGISVQGKFLGDVKGMETVVYWVSWTEPG